MKIYYKLIIFLVLFLSCSIYSFGATNEKHKTDSIHTEEYIGKISLTEPHRALKLLDEMEASNVMPLFRLDHMRSVVYQNGLDMYHTALTYSLKAYKNDSTLNHPTEALALIELITDQYNVTGNYTESTRYAVEGIELAKKWNNRESEANLLLYIGINKRNMGLRNEGNEYVEKALNIEEQEVKGSKEWDTVDNLIYIYGTKITYALEDKEYAKAIDLLPRYMELMEQLKACPDIPDGVCDMRYASVYAAYAYIFVEHGQPDKGREFYRKYLETDYAATDDGKQMRFDYLLANKQYKEALRYILEDKQYNQAKGDTVNYIYIERTLGMEAKAHMGLGDYKAAAQTYKQMYILSDSLKIREKQNGVLDFATIYETEEKEARLQQQSAELKEHRILLVSAVCIILLLGSLLWRTIRHARIIKAKNRAMVLTINEQMAHKEEMLKDQVKIHMLTAQLKQLQPDIIENNTQKEEKKESAYEELNRIVTTEKLFLNSNLTRDDLLRRIHVDKNSFSQILQEGAGVKFNEYINNLRIEHAIHLLQVYPEHTLQAIATDSGFNNMATFHTSFKKKTGMTPMEFRTAASSINS